MGKAITYLSNTLVKLEAGSKLDPKKEYHIKGFVVTGILVKSRSNTAGLKFSMVFEQDSGINNILTNFENLKDTKAVKSGAWCKMKGYENSFRQYEVQDLYESDKEFKELFDGHVDTEYSKLLSTLDVNLAKDDLESSLTLVDEDEGIYQSKEDDKYYSYNDEDELVEIEVVEE